MTKSLFVESAAREAASADVMPGQETADALLAQARRQIYHWPTDFPGFACDLVIETGPQHHVGHLVCKGSREIALEMPSMTDLRWARFQIEELVAHREAPEISNMASKTGCALGDWDPVYGQRIDFIGDKMKSYYRIKDDKIGQIGRSTNGQDFVITIDAHHDCGGRWWAAFYSAYYWSRKGESAISKVETYLDSVQSVEGLFLPAERRVSQATQRGLLTRRLSFQKVYLV